MTAARGPLTAATSGAGGIAEARSFGVVAQYWVALLACGLLGMRTSVYGGVTTGTVFGLLLAPLWYLECTRRRASLTLFGLGVLALAWGPVLTEFSAADHTVDHRQVIADSALLLQFLVGVGVLSWARQVAATSTVGVVYGLGILLQGVATGGYATSNPWKTFFAVPAAIILLSLAARSRHRATDLAALVVLTALSGAFDSRSYAATFAIGVALKLWQLRPSGLSRRGSVTSTLALFAVVGGGIYWLGSSLLVAGYLGADAQARSVEQIQTSGSLILGGRPELSATVGMMRDHIQGYGVGVSANYHDIMVAKSALTKINYDPNNGYVDKFMFGTNIELHSVFGDLWSRWGIPGLALFAVILALVVLLLVRRVLVRTATGLVLFLSCWTLWNLFFSPFYSALPTLVMCFAVLLADETSTRDASSRNPEN